MMSALEASRGSDAAADGVARGAAQIENLIRENLKRAHEKGRKSQRVRKVGVAAAVHKSGGDANVTPDDAGEIAEAATKAAGGDQEDCRRAKAEGREAALTMLNEQILSAAEKGA